LKNQPHIDFTLWLTTDQAVKYSKLCRQTLYKLLERGDIYAKKVGRKYLWSKESIDAYLNEESILDQIALHRLRSRL